MSAIASEAQLRKEVETLQAHLSELIDGTSALITILNSEISPLQAILRKISDTMEHNRAEYIERPFRPDELASLARESSLGNNITRAKEAMVKFVRETQAASDNLATEMLSGCSKFGD